MFYILGNNLGLDLVNTVIMDNGSRVDLLNSIDDLVDWMVAAGLMDAAQAARSKRKWSGTRIAAETFDQALQLRDSLRLIAEDLTHGRPVSKRSLRQLNDLLKRKSGYFEVVAVEGGYEKRFHSEIDDIGDLLVPVAESMADLLCFGDLSQVKKCENEACVLRFYDTSKNHRRRWCSMTSCGNRAKASAFYERSKSRRKSV
jgi:predicted RNA-binding Zn ribbon-like protein